MAAFVGVAFPASGRTSVAKPSPFHVERSLVANERCPLPLGIVVSPGAR
jgi:hypothetical protein